MAFQAVTRWLIVAAVPVAATLAGCSVEVGKSPSSSSSTASSTSSSAAAAPGVAKSALESVVKQRLQPKTDDPIDSVDCDGGLEAKVGATQTCSVVVGHDTYRATVTATEIKGGDVNFKIKIPPKSGGSGTTS